MLLDLAAVSRAVVGISASKVKATMGNGILSHEYTESKSAPFFFYIFQISIQYLHAVFDSPPVRLGGPCIEERFKQRRLHLIKRVGI